MAKKSKIERKTLWECISLFLLYAVQEKTVQIRILHQKNQPSTTKYNKLYTAKSYIYMYLAEL